MQTFLQFIAGEAVEFPSEDYQVRVKATYADQPTVLIPGWGDIRLFYSTSPTPHWSVHMIHGDRPGAGTLLYFAALVWALLSGDKALGSNPPTHGVIASDSTLSPDAVRVRQRIQTQYADYIYVLPHPNGDGVKVHRNDGTDWRRPATPEEATMWRLKKMPPFRFTFN